MHSDLEHMVQQISVSSLFSGRGAQLRLADSLAIPTYVKLTLQSPRALIHTTEMERCHVSEFVLPNSPEQSVPYASLYLMPPGVFPHEQELHHSVIWERPRDQGQPWLSTLMNSICLGMGFPYADLALHGVLAKETMHLQTSRCDIQ